MTEPQPAQATPATAPAAPGLQLRPLRSDDLPAVIALDQGSSGPGRRGYFERRLDAAVRAPSGHVQIGLQSGGELRGFLLARIAGGEYGRAEDVVVIEAVGVAAASRRSGLGRRMLAELESLARARGVRQLVTQVEWRNHSMLHYLAGAGFALAPRLILERAVGRMGLPATDEEIETWPPIVRTLRASDLEAVVDIDGKISGQRRRGYFTRKFDEALRQSAIEVSLLAELQKRPAGFAMARVDYGDFGHLDPTAALETLGVEPAAERQGLGRAMLAQLVENLAALHVRRLETEVAADAFPLLRFFHAAGFHASQRLSFQKALLS